MRSRSNMNKYDNTVVTHADASTIVLTRKFNSRLKTWA
jgi:hypothetical protein